MAKMTLLEMTQNILSSLDSDEVNSISDTTESLQVARIVQNKYYDIVTRGALPEQQVLFQLDPATDAAKPVLMYVPDGTVDIEWIKYFDSTSTDLTYKYVTVMAIDQFLDQVNRYDPAETNVGTFVFTEGSYSFDLYYKNDAQPKYCCIIENNFVLFDSYDSTLETTLESSKTMVYGQTVSPFTFADGFTPDIDDSQFSLLLNEAKSLAFYELKQMMHQKADQEIKRQWSSVQKNKSVSNKPSYFDQLPDFGRVPRTGGYSSGIYKWMRQANP